MDRTYSVDDLEHHPLGTAGQDGQYTLIESSGARATRCPSQLVQTRQRPVESRIANAKIFGWLIYASGFGFGTTK
jgi:hypothetical protein